jgi:hypothetical protein
MDAAFQGKLRLKFGANGVRLPLIPMTPHLAYDSKYIEAMNAKIPPAPIDTVDRRATNMIASLSVDADDGSLVAPIPGQSVGDPVRLPPNGGGNGKGKPGPGEGDEDESNDITIPTNLYRQLLAKHFEIPNTRMTDGETPMMRELRMGERRDPSEEPMWEKMVGDALVKGLIARRAKGEKSPLAKVSPATLIREGFKKLDEDDYIIRSKRDIPLPSFDAVVVLNIDLSGSMQGHRLQLVKNFAYNIRELFRSVYPDVKFHYVGLDSKAKEYSEKEIWNVDRGGSTEYAPAMQETKKILSKYPYSRWNRYVFFAGDSELFDLAKFMKEFHEMKNSLQYFGLVVTRDPDEPKGIDSNGLRAALDASKQEWKWIGITQINDQPEIFDGLRDLFPKQSN